MQILELSWPVQTLEQSLASVWPDVQVEVLPELDSTNSTLLERARAGWAQPALLVAERQTAGRGRMGRQWLSQPAGGSLTFSLGFPLGQADLSGLSVVVGYSLAQALDVQYRHELRVKWPNDLWFRQRKFGGILVEVCTQGAHRYAVVGVGINVVQPSALPPVIAQQPQPQAPAWVQEFEAQATAPWVLERVAAPLARAMQQFMERGFAPWQERFAMRDALAGQVVWLSDGSTGKAVGVSQQGAFLIENQSSLREIRSEEISVRPIDMMQAQ